jgi:hypothetical protein
MTLNLTALSPHYVVQVSDRRFTQETTSGSFALESDDANKAVVLSCSDSLLAITFTGLGRLRTTRVDEWLVKVLQEEALCELEADIVIEKFTKLTTDWFRSFRSCWTGQHTFIFAGFQKKSKFNQPRPRLWFVTNAESVGYSSFSAGTVSKTGMYVTGWLSAFTRAERRRVQAACRKAKNVEQIEATLVDGIRNAASRDHDGPIGKSCMSISLVPPRTAVSRFHPYGVHPHNFAPHVVWYEGGRNFLVKGIDHLHAGQYSLVFGGDACAIVVRPGQGVGSPSSQEILARFNLRFTEAKYHSGPVTESSLVKIVDD